MTTVAQLVTRSLRILRVVDAYEAPEAEQMTNAIGALNAMLRRWEANGMSLGWVDVDNPADTLPVPAEAEEAIAYNLAVKLRGEYGAAMEPDTIQLARDGLDALRRDVKVANPLGWDRRGCSYDVYTDEYH